MRNLFSTRDEANHCEDKKVANAYSMTSLLEMEPTIDSCFRLFMQKYAPYSKTGKPVDLGAWLYVFVVYKVCVC